MNLTHLLRRIVGHIPCWLGGPKYTWRRLHRLEARDASEFITHRICNCGARREVKARKVRVAL